MKMKDNGMKTCSTCKLTKDVKAFRRDRSRSDGWSSYCRLCAVQHFINLKKQAFQNYGGIFCCNCGEDFFEALVLDHINNDGAQHRKRVGSGDRIYYDLKRRDWPLGFQVLCYTCNQLKQRQPHLLQKYAEKKNAQSESSTLVGARVL